MAFLSARIVKNLTRRSDSSLHYLVQVFAPHWRDWPTSPGVYEGSYTIYDNPVFLLQCLDETLMLGWKEN